MMKTAIDLARKALFFFQTKMRPGRYLEPVVDYYGRGKNNRGNALLIYRTMPFHLEASHPAFNFHQSMIQSILIAKALDNKGFKVDITDHSRTEPPPAGSYDLVISHNCSEIPSKSPYKDARKIYLASGTEHRTHNLRQKQRIQAFEGRRGKHDVELVWDGEEMPWTDSADAIFCFGNERIADTWRSRFSCPVLPFQNTAIRELRPLKRNWADARNHFLFLGSRQQLAKGLDILLETFARMPELHLHVCGHFRRDKVFCEIYKKELFYTSNIHAYGWVNVTGTKFKSLASRCGFTISATCAEGSPGSITNAMMMGMIPILPSEAGIDEGNGVLPFDNVLGPDLDTVLRNYASLSEIELEKTSNLAVSRAKAEFTDESFLRCWEGMISKIVEDI
jgi:glycosyltransferase involved in cell wall biosynthesis